MSAEKDNFQNTILFFCPQGLPEVYSQILESDKKTNKYDFGEIIGSGQAEDLLVKHDSASVLFCIQNKDDLVQLLTLCKVNNEKIRQGILKVGGLNLTGSHKLDDILKKSGVSDVFLDSISSKTLDYKLNFWSKGIKTNLKKIQTVIKGNFKFDGKPGSVPSGKEAGGESNDAGKVSVVPALNFTSDCWLTDTAPEQPRKVMGHWIVDLVGPSPYAGRWVEIKNANVSEDQLWEWVPLHIEVFQFIEHEGRWVAKGKQPQFLWKSNSWKFMGIAPALCFQLEKGDPVVRFVTENNQLTISEDSKYALAKKALIQESFDPKIVQKKDTDKSKENLEDEAEAEANKKAFANETEDDEELEMLAKKEAKQIADLKGVLGAAESFDNLQGKGQEAKKSDKFYKGKVANKDKSDEADEKSLEIEAKKLGSLLSGKLKKDDSDKKSGPQGMRDSDLKLATNSVEEMAKEIKRKREEEAKKKETSGLTSPKGIDGLIAGKFKTLREDKESGAKNKDENSIEELEKAAKRQALRSDKELKKPEFSNTKLDIAFDKEKINKKKNDNNEDSEKSQKTRAESLIASLNDEHADELDLKGDSKAKREKEGKSDREKRESPFNKHSGIPLVTDLKKDGLKGIKREAEEREGRKHSGIGEGPEKGIGSNLGVDRMHHDPMAGKGGTDNLEDDPLSGEQDGADKLNKFLHGKTAWKDELGGHLRLTKLNIELLMSVKGSSVEEAVTLGDVIDNLLVIYASKSLYSYGQNAKIKITCSYGNLDLNFTVAGKIVDLYDNDDETDCCNLELNEYDDNKLKQLKRLFGDRQKNITNFFIQAKGIT